ncbi:TPR-like protein [Armillaria borealis]|uniref:TPR-like protein n=1 Tax=Armillaria borealis TaxID=47425 RepID=A0AA39MXW9_9AGAR|nr:TPR-like protein [Armillaria borealis]
MSSTDKLETGKQHKETGDQAFKTGDYKAALSAYYMALMYLQGLDKNAIPGMSVTPSRAEEENADKKLSEIDEIISKIYGNMSACHFSQQNWKRTIETADKALTKNEKNYKALFRKGKALGEQGYIERAIKVLEDLKKKSPEDGPKADAEIARLNAIDKARAKVERQKLKGFLTREREPKSKSKAAATTDHEEEIESIVSPGVASSS